jgi:uncharacterized protein YecT (DUF1311 family)
MNATPPQILPRHLQNRQIDDKVRSKFKGEIMTRSYRLATMLAALVLVVGAHGAAAQTNCTGGSLKTASDCFNKLLDQANADMQAKYSDAQTTLKHANGQQSQFDAQLAKSQDTWLTYRSQTCDELVQPYFEEGAMQNIAVTSCKLALTKERASDLQNMFQGLWGLQQ